jgi:hypothetical protein
VFAAQRAYTNVCATSRKVAALKTPHLVSQVRRMAERRNDPAPNKGIGLIGSLKAGEFRITRGKCEIQRSLKRLRGCIGGRECRPAQCHLQNLVIKLHDFAACLTRDRNAVSLRISSSIAVPQMGQSALSKPADSTTRMHDKERYRASRFSDLAH